MDLFVPERRDFVEDGGARYGLNELPLFDVFRLELDDGPPDRRIFAEQFEGGHRVPFQACVGEQGDGPVHEPVAEFLSGGEGDVTGEPDLADVVVVVGPRDQIVGE